MRQRGWLGGVNRDNDESDGELINTQGGRRIIIFRRFPRPSRKQNMDPLTVAEITACLLKCAPLVILVVFGRAQTAANNYPVLPKGSLWTLLDVSHMTLLVASAALSIAEGWLMLEYAIVDRCISVAVLRESGSSIAMAFSLILLLVTVWRRRHRCLPPSAFVVASLGLLCTACVLNAFRLFTMVVEQKDITTSASHLERISLVVSFLVLVGVIGSFLLAEIHDLMIDTGSSSSALF
ncbi:hypothetical protein HPB50_010383 [Hyalomma asiaticum]|uniref:Uncharacterized protein n=1 Tax=Hyalomma asiaticum TaxID=266040 RepID=A0ACB7TGD5_HYAAI|nr:hypothetical protein HPB50_010383 [Hyalomma asiaticum]